MASILVIDDDPTVRITLQKSLCRVGHTVYLATSGANGLAKAQECTPDIIVCSYQMRDMDGLSLCQQIRSIPAISQVYFILLTGQLSESSIVQAGWLLQRTTKTTSHSSVDDFIPKYPRIQEIELESRIRCGIAVQQAKRQLVQQQEHFSTQLDQATSYVQSLMPRDLEQGPVQIKTHFEPANHLGGDGFNYVWLDQDHLLVYLLDVVGHGFLPAMVAVSVINWLNAHGGKDPAAILTDLNQYFYHHLRGSNGQNLYCTVWCGLVHLPSHQLTFATAGHPPAALLYKDATGNHHLERLTAATMPIGMDQNTQYTNISREIPQGSHLCIFSDGIYEFTRSNQQTLGLEHFLELVAGVYAKYPAIPDVATLDHLDQPTDSCQLLPHIVQQVRQLIADGSGLADDLSLMELYFVT